MSKTQEERIKKLREALEHYTNQMRLEPPADWDYPGMGGPPELSDMEEVDIGEVARQALIDDET